MFQILVDVTFANPPFLTLLSFTHTNSLVLPSARATPCVAVNRWSGALILVIVAVALMSGEALLSLSM